MKVLHFFKTYLPDSFTGIERVIWQIAEGAATHGVESRVLSLSAMPAENGYPVGRHTAFQARSDLYIASTGFSRSVFRSFSEQAEWADIIHYHFPWPMMDVVDMTVRPKVPRLVTYHSDIVRQRLLLPVYKPVMHRFLRRVEKIVATSPNYLASSAILARYRNKASVIPIGIADEPAPDTDLVRTWRAQVGEGFFLFLGVLRYYKGLPFLLAAAAQSRLPLVIAGKGELAATVREMALDNVRLVEEVSEADKAALFALSRAFVFPSHLRSEAFGIALLEAARAGKALISCEIGTGTSYINQHEETGFVVPPQDSQALAAAMTRLAEDKDATLQMGAAARQRYETHFQADDMVRAYLSLYEDLVR